MIKLALTPENQARYDRQRASATPEIIRLARFLQSTAFDGRLPASPHPLYLAMATYLAMNSVANDEIMDMLEEVRG